MSTALSPEERRAYYERNRAARHDYEVRDSALRRAMRLNPSDVDDLLLQARQIERFLRGDEEPK